MVPGFFPKRLRNCIPISMVYSSDIQAGSKSYNSTLRQAAFPKNKSFCKLFKVRRFVSDQGHVNITELVFKKF